jgi:hypothetical protein
MNILIRFTTHARRKFRVLKELGFEVNDDQVLKTIRKATTIERTWKNRFVASSRLNSTHILRVVYEKENGNIVVVTFYPSRRERYESKL